MYLGIIVETSKPIGEGTLYINNIRSIDPDLAYSKEQIRNFVGLETQTNITQITDNGYYPIEEKTLLIALEETNTNANIIIDKTNLSTIVTNEDVEIKIELDNNRYNTDLYENPIFMIELPEYIENINIKEANVMYDENLKIESFDGIVENEKTYLQIKLAGVQDGFSPGSFTNGTNIVLKTDIKAKLLTPNLEDHINLYYLNPNAISYTNNVLIGNQIAGKAETTISYSTPPEMIAVATISNYDNTGNTVSSIKQGVQTDKIAIYDNAKTARMQLKIVNNTGNTCNNVFAIGRIPFAGNKNISTGENLGTTKDTYLISPISVSGIDQNKLSIYYSENGEATTDLNNQQNGWTNAPEDITKMKSYLIVLNNDYEMTTGTTIDAYYDFQIPANLEHGNDFYETFEVRFINNAYTGAVEETVTADTVGLSTGEGPKVEAIQTIDSIEGIVRSGDVVKVIAIITNTGSVDLENVVLREYIPKHTKYTEYREGWGDVGQVKSEYIYPQTSIEPETGKEYIDIPVGKVAVDDLVYVDFQLKMDEIAEDNAEILINEMAIMADNLSNPYRLIDGGTAIRGTGLKVTEVSSIDSRIPITEGNEIYYTVKVKNTTGSTINNISAKKILPMVLEYMEASIQEYNEISGKWENKKMAEYNNTFRTVEWKIDSLASGEEARLIIKASVGILGENQYEQEIEGITVVMAEGHETASSNGVKNTVSFPHLEAKITGNASKEYISEGDEIVYTIDVKNNGSLAATSVEFEDILPQELHFVEANYVSSTDNKKTNITENDNRASFIKNIMPDENIKITITAKAKSLPNNVEEATIINYATFESENGQAIVTEQVMTRIEQNPNMANPVDTTNNSNNSNNGNGGNVITNQNGSNQGNNDGNSNTISGTQEKTFRVRGTAWIDDNANGQRDSGEQLLSGVKVVLANATTKEIIKDRISGAEKNTTTARRWYICF